MSNFVFVLDTHKRPLDPIHPGTARQLLTQGKAAVFRRYPFCIILKEARPDIPVQDLELKLDPGSKITGIAIKQGDNVIFGAELHHRVDTVLTWVRKLIRLAPISSITQELVRFDLQLMQNPEISGVLYQQGALQGYEVREYLLAKWNRQCAYCSVEHVPFEVEHIHSRAKGGSDRVSNLTLACHDCNQKKGTQDVRDFLASKPDLLNRILKQATSPLKDAAVVNSTRWALFNALKQTGLPITTGTGGQTKFNRKRLALPKVHWLDAACVGEVDTLNVIPSKPLLIAAKGHGTRQMCRTNTYGFPTRHVPRKKFVKGFQTGDIVKAVVTTGKKSGTYVGRVAVRSTGSFNISAAQGLLQGISHRYCKPIHHKDGYSYGY